MYQWNSKNKGLFIKGYYKYLKLVSIKFISNYQNEVIQKLLYLILYIFCLLLVFAHCMGKWMQICDMQIPL